MFSRIGYSQSDDSPMANRIFDPATVDAVHSSPAEVRQLLAAYHANTNYSVVDADLIEALYRRSYHERVVGTQRFRLMSVSRVTEAREREDVVEVTVKNLHTGASTVLLADALICATGYEPTNPLSLLGDVGPLLESDDTGQLRVDRDYRVRADPRMVGGVYLCGGTEHTHGISSSLLSNTAVRAGEILRSVLERRAADLTAPAAPQSALT